MPSEPEDLRNATLCGKTNTERYDAYPTDVDTKSRIKGIRLPNSIRHEAGNPAPIFPTLIQDTEYGPS